MLVGARLQMCILNTVALLIGYLALVYAFGIPSGGEEIARNFFFFSAFLTGYGVDSIASTVGSPIDKRAAEQQANIKKRLEGD